MTIEQNGDVKLMVFGTVKIPVRASIYDIIEEVKKLTQEQQNEIISSEGLEVTPGIEDRIILHTAMSFVQNAWFITTTGQLSEAVRLGHEGRIEAYNRLVVKAKAAPAPKVKVPKAPKAPKAPKEPKAANAGGNAAPSTARISGRLYTINPNGDGAIAATFSGFRKSIHETLVLAGPEAKLTFEQVLEQTKGRGVIFKGADGGKNQTAYQLKELVAMNIATLSSPVEETVPTQPASEAVPA